MKYEGQHMTCTVGIPGCGKSTWAKEETLASYNCIVNLERDVLRAFSHTSTGNLWDYKYSKDKEAQVTKLQERLIRRALADGKSVIVSDTNLNEKTRNRMMGIAAEYNLTVNWQVFDIPLHQCMKWNSKRPNHVPESVLIRMEQNMRKYLGKYVQDKTDRKERLLPDCVIVDIDGTIADMKGIRGPFDWDNVGKDRVIPHVAAYIRSLYESGQINVFIFSGRDGSCMELTKEWLDTHEIGYDGLFMREAGSQVNDSIIKEELFDKHIKGKYTVSHIVDDRAQVCKMWESMGFNVMNVGGFLADF